MDFRVEDDFRNIFPHARIGILICTNINNQRDGSFDYQVLLDEHIDLAKKLLEAPVFSENEVIKVWRQAFQQFKTKKGARSSIEALLKRVDKNKGVVSINPLVDIYNAISLKYGFPCGGEDIDTFVGDVRLTLANGNEDFLPLGENDVSLPFEGEVIYKDDIGAICRCFNWREAARTMLTEKTINALMVLESIDPNRNREFEEALEELKILIENHLGGQVSLYIMEKDKKSQKIK